MNNYHISSIYYDTQMYTVAIGLPFIVTLEEKFVILVIVKCNPLSKMCTGRKKYDKDAVTVGILHMGLILPHPPRLEVKNRSLSHCFGVFTSSASNPTLRKITYNEFPSTRLLAIG